MLKAFLFLIILDSVWAHEECGVQLPHFNDFEEIQQHLMSPETQYFESKSAACVRKHPFSDQEMHDFINKPIKKYSGIRGVNGVAFENESEENLRAFELLTTPLDASGRKDLSRKVTYTSECKNVLCAVQGLFGKEVGTRILFLQRRFGFNGSHLVTNKAAAWKKDELDKILLGLSDFPVGVLPVEESRPLRRALPGAGNRNVAANSNIEVFDHWTKLPLELARATILHEVSHVIGARSGIDESKEWRDIGGWKKKGSGYSTNRPNSFISAYAMTDPYEDFSESVEAYRYTPKRLLEASPEKYHYLRKTVFNNVEYLSENHCQNARPYSQQMHDKAVKRYKHWTPDSETVNKVVSACHEKAIDKIYEAGSVNLNSPEIMHCYSKELQRELKTSMAPHVYLKDRLQNMDDIPLSKNAKRDFYKRALLTHRKQLIDDFQKGFQGASYFNPLCLKDKIELSQSFPTRRNYRPGYQSGQLAAIASKACQDIKKNRNLQNSLLPDFTNGEVIEYSSRLITIR